MRPPKFPLMITIRFLTTTKTTWSSAQINNKNKASFGEDRHSWTEYTKKFHLGRKGAKKKNNDDNNNNF